ncbi:SGNH/GDSL hydrolase family protein [Runella limosa]|uniref:SGNH/GDSL hydrolase family protein n=1 Tax=Runella limosa TaxID=370978 RepID=UPI000411D0C9|nr:SGNH/GDSL hydrolase family protein [Runella limosa]
MALFIMKLSRRTFLTTAAVSPLVPRAHVTNPKRFVFIGDSITDGNRGRNTDPNHILGHGYVFSIATRLGAKFSERGLSFVNRGISGNTINDLKERWTTDVYAHQPEVLTVLVGINDFHKYVKTSDDLHSPANYESTFRTLMKDTVTQFPDVTCVVMSPFLVPVGATFGEMHRTHLDLFNQYHAASKAIAVEFGAIFIDLQAVFARFSNQPNYDYWIWDGIHPTYSGHELITQAWLKAVKRKVKFVGKV